MYCHDACAIESPLFHKGGLVQTCLRSSCEENTDNQPNPAEVHRCQNKHDGRFVESHYILKGLWVSSVPLINAFLFLMRVTLLQFQLQ